MFMPHPSSPTSRPLRDVDDVAAHIAATTWAPSTEDRLGLEVEAFPLLVKDGQPLGRLPLFGDELSVVGVVGEVAAANQAIHPRVGEHLSFPTRFGGAVTFEPGGQFEYSTSPATTTAELRAELDEVWDPLSATFLDHGVCLLALGTDPWHEGAETPQQLEQPRYQAMAAYLASRSPAGAEMMRNTTAVQVSLDAGTGATREERWYAANLISPLLTAMFASSPGPGIRSRRARAWQTLDPTRTGFPRWDDGESDPVGDTVRSALEADVIFAMRGDQVIPGRPGWRFASWLADGHPVAGQPTADDLQRHLTTLFTEVRPRHGVLELRAIDGLPRRWWLVPLVLAGGSLYDPRARREAIELLEPHRSDLDGLWRRAAGAGLSDPVVGRLAARFATIAIEGARRQPERFDATSISAAATFIEEFTLSALSPSNLLEDLLYDPATALAWAAPEHTMKGAA